MGFFDGIFGNRQSKDVELYMERGKYFLGIGSFRDAANYFDAVVCLDPNHPTGWVARGIAFEKLGYYYDANESFSKAELLGNTVGTNNKERLASLPINLSAKSSKIPVASWQENPYGDKRNYYYK